jgi:hypothetical protein
MACELAGHYGQALPDVGGVAHMQTSCRSECMCETAGPSRRDEVRGTFMRSSAEREGRRPRGESRGPFALAPLPGVPRVPRGRVPGSERGRAAGRRRSGIRVEERRRPGLTGREPVVNVAGRARQPALPGGGWRGSRARRGRTAGREEAPLPGDDDSPARRDRSGARRRRP